MIIIYLLSFHLQKMKSKIVKEISIPESYIPRNLYGDNILLCGELETYYFFLRIDFVKKLYRIKLYHLNGDSYKSVESGEIDFFQNYYKLYSSDEKIKINFFKNNLIFELEFHDIFLNFVLKEKNLKVLNTDEIICVDNELNTDSIFVENGVIKNIKKYNLSCIKNINCDDKKFLLRYGDTIIYGDRDNRQTYADWSNEKIKYKLIEDECILISIGDNHKYFILRNIDENFSFNQACVLFKI